MILGFNGLTSKHTTLMEDIHGSSRNGFGAIELRDYKIESYLADFCTNDLSALLSNNKIIPVAINSIEIDESSFTDNHLYLDKLSKLSTIAEAIMCPIIVVAPMLNESGLDKKQVKRHLVKIFREMSDLCYKSKNLKIGLEYIGLPKAMIKTLDETLELLNEIDRKNVGLVIDTFAFYANSSRVSDIKKINPGDLLLVHLNDSDAAREEVVLQESNRIFPGDGVIPFDEIIPELLKIGFDGVFSIELINPEIWEWDPSVIYNKSFASLQSVVGSYYGGDNTRNS